MDFASRELAKYGWEAGSGLGANQDGIKKPGIGEEDNQAFQWWDSIFNKATSKISIMKDEEGEVSISSSKTTKVNVSSLYSGRFVKSGDADDANKDWSQKISDADLLAACEGRTARKGARLDQHGKIQRADEGGVVASAITKQAVIDGYEPQVVIKLAAPKQKKLKKLKLKKSKKSKKGCDESELKKKKRKHKVEEKNSKKKKRKRKDCEGEKSAKKRKRDDCDGVKSAKKKKSKHE